MLWKLTSPIRNEGSPRSVRRGGAPRHPNCQGETLRNHPHPGRVGAEPGIREFVSESAPFLVLYRVPGQRSRSARSGTGHSGEKSNGLPATRGRIKLLAGCPSGIRGLEKRETCAPRHLKFSTWRAMPPLRSEQPPPLAGRRKPSDWRLRLRPCGCWPVLRTTAQDRG
jgi:hypothetical protein